MSTPKRARVPQEILDRFDEACANAFEEMFQAMVALVRRERELRLGLSGKRITIEFEEGFSGSHEHRTEIHGRAISIIGRCGARVGAAVKQAQRQLLIMVMSRARDSEGVDVTPAVAHRVARELLGRGVDKVALNRVFGTPGRTAAQKSLAFVDEKQLKGIETEKERFARLNTTFCESAALVRDKHRRQWFARWTAFRRNGGEE